MAQERKACFSGGVLTFNLRQFRSPQLPGKRCQQTTVPAHSQRGWLVDQYRRRMPLLLVTEAFVQECGWIILKCEVNIHAKRTSFRFLRMLSSFKIDVYARLCKITKKKKIFNDIFGRTFKKKKLFSLRILSRGKKKKNTFVMIYKNIPSTVFVSKFVDKRLCPPDFFQPINRPTQTGGSRKQSSCQREIDFSISVK